MGSSALPAGGHLVHGKVPAARQASLTGESTLESAGSVPVACAPCPGRTTDGRRSSRRAARALGRARLAREGLHPSPSNRPDSTWLSWAVHSLYAGFALGRGLSATPRSPMGSRKNLSQTGCSPACLQPVRIIRVPDGCKTPERGLKTWGSLVPLVVNVRPIVCKRRRQRARTAVIARGPPRESQMLLSRMELRLGRMLLRRRGVHAATLSSEDPKGT